MSSLTDQKDLAGVLSILHNNFRIGGVSEPYNSERGISLNNDNFPVDNLDPLYLLGLLTPLLFMAPLLSCWLSFICFRSRYLDTSRLSEVYLARFWFSCNFGLAFLCFLISVGGVVLFQNGSSEGLDITSDLVQNLSTASLSLEALSNVTATLKEIDNLAKLNCQDDEIIELLPNLKETKDSLDFADVIDFQKDFMAELEIGYDEASSAISSLSLVLKVFLAHNLLYFVLFMILFCISQVNKSNTDDESRCSRFLSIVAYWHKNYGLTYFSMCNIILPVVVLTIALVMGFIGMVGADHCLPSIALDLLIYASGDTVPDIEQLCNIVDTEASTEEIGDEYLFCHYLFCEGDNIFFYDLGIETVRSEADEFVQLESIELKTNLLNINVAIEKAVLISDQDCLNTLNEFSSQVTQLHDTAMKALELVACDVLSPMITNFLQDTTCDTFIAGIAIIYITWLSCAIFLMLAAVTYPAIQPRTSSGQDGAGQDQMVRNDVPSQPGAHQEEDPDAILMETL